MEMLAVVRRDAGGRRRADARRAERARRARAGHRRHRRDRRRLDERRAVRSRALARIRITSSRAPRSTKCWRCSRANIRPTSPPSSTRASAGIASPTRSPPRAASRMVAVISGGTIPDRGLYTVNLPDRTRLGELDEEFVHESRIGDVFQLGSSTWRVNAIEHDRVIVTPAPGAPARMPFWHGEYAARSAHLAPRVGELRRELDAVRTDEQLARRSPSAIDADVATTRVARRLRPPAARRHRRRARRACARRRAVPRRDGLAARRDPRAVRRTRERAVGTGARQSRSRMARRAGARRARRSELRAAGADDRRRHHAAPAEPQGQRCPSRCCAISPRRKPSGACSTRWARRRCSARASG